MTDTGKTLSLSKGQLKSNAYSILIRTDLTVEVCKAYQHDEKNLRIPNIVFNIVSFLLNHSILPFNEAWVYTFLVEASWLLFWHMGMRSKRYLTSLSLENCWPLRFSFMNTNSYCAAAEDLGQEPPSVPSWSLSAFWEPTLHRTLTSQATLLNCSHYHG